MGHLLPLVAMLRMAVRERVARPGRARVPEPMVMDDAEGVRAFHDSAPAVQMPVYEFNASMMSRLLPRDGRVLDLGSGSGQLAAHLAAGRPDATTTCVDLSEEMLATGRRMADERGLNRLAFVVGDITSLSDELVGAPDLVCCNWTLHQLPDRETAVVALREVARIRDLHGSAVWLFDFARLRRPDTTPALLDTLAPDADSRLRADAVASEAAAWTVEEMLEMLAEAGLTDLNCSRHRMLGLYQAWWSPRRRGPTAAPPWKRPPISSTAAFWADRLSAAMSNHPAT